MCDPEIILKAMRHMTDRHHHRLVYPLTEVAREIEFPGNLPAVLQGGAKMWWAKRL